MPFSEEDKQTALLQRVGQDGLASDCSVIKTVA